MSVNPKWAAWAGEELKRLSARIAVLEKDRVTVEDYRRNAQNILELRSGVIDMFTPSLETDILERLKVKPWQTERELVAAHAGLSRLVFYYAWRSLEKQRAIISTSRGRGRPRTWAVCLEPVKKS